ncbi:hypothetical protein ACFOW6_04875 [Fodinicurvata halophila]|uniref:DUF2933 domain-containing protein n=1 Tax=Fodinicurvata halophila TaxID=1419723 RepID=A0ABV8UHX2_9PROT
MHYYLSDRRGLVLLAGLAIMTGLALNWSWVAAAGLAPILISVLPCLAMCALGLCMKRADGKSCSNAAKASDPAAVDGATPTAQSIALEDPPAAPKPAISGDASLTNPELEPSKERRATDA